MNILDIITLLTLLAGIFIYINVHYLKLPSPVGLIILSITLSLGLLICSLIVPEFKNDVIQIMSGLDYETVLFEIILSFMLFAGAINVDFHKLGQSKIPTIVLAIVGVLISTFLIGWGIHCLLRWVGIELDMLPCFVFGALISPTDPVAVIYTIRKYSLSENLSEKIKGESLLNNGVSVVLAVLLNQLALANEIETLTVLDYVSVSTIFIFGGAVFGVILGLIGYEALLIIDNDKVEVEILITIALVMVATQICNFFEVSAVQAIVLMGLIIGNKGRTEGEEGAAGDYMYKFWYLVEESFNVVLFVVIGLVMIVLDVRLELFTVGFFSIIVVLASRWLSIVLPIKVSSMRKLYDTNTINVLSWGGLRSGLSIALALSLPDFSSKEIFITLAYIVVVCSVLLQGLTMSRLFKNSVNKDAVIKNKE
jgi:CPA1 family monovalent cation:H+ antiporter